MPDGPDLRVAIGATRECAGGCTASGITCRRFLPRPPCPAHRADVGQLRQPANDIANRVDAWLGRFHPLVGHDEAALERDVDRRLEAACRSRARGAADGDQNLLGRLFGLGLAGGRRANDTTVRRPPPSSGSSRPWPRQHARRCRASCRAAAAPSRRLRPLHSRCAAGLR